MATIDERLARLEAQVLELGNKQATSQQSMEDSVHELKGSMEAWKNEIIELLRLNRPPPPVIEMILTPETNTQQSSMGSTLMKEAPPHSPRPSQEKKPQVSASPIHGVAPAAK
nr:uncharacterized protein LOC109186281 [Ipomoea trifida]